MLKSSPEIRRAEPSCEGDMMGENENPPSWVSLSVGYNGRGFYGLGPQSSKRWDFNLQWGDK